MEDLWRIKDMGYRLHDWDNYAEYQRLVKEFRADEERYNRKNLLQRGIRLHPSTAEEK